MAVKHPLFEDPHVNGCSWLPADYLRHHQSMSAEMSKLESGRPIPMLEKIRECQGIYREDKLLCRANTPDVSGYVFEISDELRRTLVEFSEHMTVWRRGWDSNPR